jgi:lipopolysaccharide transport system ATP-binding protein
MVKPTVLVERVSKKFGNSLNNALKFGLIDSAKRMIGVKKENDLRDGEFWALKDIDFSLEPGDALGMMGVNGSGKTTLLRIFNGTYSPDKGKVTLRGRIGALIAAGAGFSPLLTGRENVYISATLLGMKPHEIARKFDEIVAFAELAEFIDMPVRNYSSGMSVRLGFAIAVIGSPDILLVDEVLAVGDINFQKKCFERIQELKNEGTTILLVSHSPGAIWAVCNKGLVLHKGISTGIIPVEDACREYDHFNMLSRFHPDDNCNLSSDYGGLAAGTGDIIVNCVELLNDAGNIISEIPYGKSFILRLHIDVKRLHEDLIFRIQVDAEINKCISIIDSYEAHNCLYKLETGKHVLDIEIKNPNLRPGVYTFSPSITQKNIGVHLFYKFFMASLRIKHTTDRFFYADFRASVYLNSDFVLKNKIKFVKC